MTDPAKAAAALRESDDPYGLKLKGERHEKILVINCGSSSLKYSSYESQRCITPRLRVLIDRVGMDGTRTRSIMARRVLAMLPEFAFPSSDAVDPRP